MKTACLAMTLVALAAGSRLAAQQPSHPQRPHPMGVMQQMDSLDTRLDSLVARMNRATGNQKVAAMADVINELVTQRRTMAGRMRMMMDAAGTGRRMGSRESGMPKDSAHAHHPKP